MALAAVPLPIPQECASHGCPVHMLQLQGRNMHTNGPHNLTTSLQELDVKTTSFDTKFPGT